MKGIIRKIVLVLCIGVFFFSAYQLYTILSEYQKGSAEYDSVFDAVVTEELPEATVEDAKETVFKVDFEKLQAMNQEAVAWIRFEEPDKISYPVLQAADNDKYLKTTFEGKTNAAGALFVDTENAGDFSDKNTFIYGHNMKNGSMFGQLRKYKSEAFGKENPYFYIYTPDGREIQYQVFAVCIVEDTADSYNKFYEDENEYADYIKMIRNLSRYDVDVEVTTDSQIVSLSTCTNVSETERLLVHGVKIAEKSVEE